MGRLWVARAAGWVVNVVLAVLLVDFAADLGLLPVSGFLPDEVGGVDVYWLVMAPFFSLAGLRHYYLAPEVVALWRPPRYLPRRWGECPGGPAGSE